MSVKSIPWIEVGDRREPGGVVAVLGVTGEPHGTATILTRPVAEALFQDLKVALREFDESCARSVAGEQE